MKSVTVVEVWRGVVRTNADGWGQSPLEGGYWQVQSATPVEGGVEVVACRLNVERVRDDD